MTQLTDEHFELHDRNKAEMYKQKKIEYIEDKIKVLEKTLESHAKILARFQMTENNEPDFVHSQGFSLKERS